MALSRNRQNTSTARIGILPMGGNVSDSDSARERARVSLLRLRQARALDAGKISLE
jgi:hypothetical protein